MHDTEMTVMKKDKCLFSLGGTFFSKVLLPLFLLEDQLTLCLLKAEKCQEIPLDFLKNRSCEK